LRYRHIDEPTPHVDWTGGVVELLVEARRATRMVDRQIRRVARRF
jgi:hypothetical protein